MQAAIHQTTAPQQACDILSPYHTFCVTASCIARPKNAMKMTRYLSPSLQSRWFLPGIAVAGTLMRLALLYYTWVYRAPTFADELDYERIGRSLSNGMGFIKDGIHYTAYRAPAQPIFIAVVFRLLGHNLLYVKIAEAIFLAMIPFLCARIGRSLGLSVAASNAGAAIATFHPALAYASSTLYPSVLTACALTLGVWLCYLAIQNSRIGTSIAAGLSLGVAGSATTTFAPLALLAALVMLFKKAYRSAIIVGLLGTIPIVLWMARNEVALGKFTVATNGGYNLYLGANDDATPTSGNWVDPHLFDEQIIGELAVDDDYRNLAVTWIKAHPTRWGRLVLIRSVMVLDSVGNPRTQGIHSGLPGHIAGWLLLPVVLMGVFGLIFHYKSPLSWMTVAALALVIVSSALTIVKPRFRFPCDPILCEFAVAGFIQTKSRLEHFESKAKHEPAVLPYVG
jgi:hypothetical protein